MFSAQMIQNVAIYIYIYIYILILPIQTTITIPKPHTHETALALYTKSYLSENIFTLNKMLYDSKR